VVFTGFHFANSVDVGPPLPTIGCELATCSKATYKGVTHMRKFLLRLDRDEAGQGLVEYLLILALVAFAAPAGMGSLARSLNSAFEMVARILGSYIT
jgi:pilus assembly protein Flp/PilA